MSTPSPFSVARETGTNLYNAFREKKDENAIERILADSMNSDDPKVLQSNIGKILSQVSPERQGVALKYLQGVHSNVLKKQQQEQQFERERQAGLTPGLSPAVQAQQLRNTQPSQSLQTAMYKEQQKNERIANANNIFNPSGNAAQNQTQQNSGPSLDQQAPALDNNTRKQRLLELTGHPDREVSERAKAELKSLEADEKQVRADLREQRNIDQRKEESVIKRNTDISQEIIKEAEKEAQTLVAAESALALMQDAIANKDLSFWTTDNLAELTGIEGFRSPEGALFKTAGKEFFLGSLNRAGARPNQFIEKQISEMLPKIGRSTAANLGVARAFENEIDLKREKVRLTRDLAQDLEKKLGYVPRNIGQIRDQELKTYAEKKQKELNNDLRALKSIEEKSIQPFIKVEPGTPISKVVAESLLRQFNNDPKKAADEAKKLGYSF